MMVKLSDNEIVRKNEAELGQIVTKITQIFNMEGA
jgi:hypothetical protein